MNTDYSASNLTVSIRVRSRHARHSSTLMRLASISTIFWLVQLNSVGMGEGRRLSSQTTPSAVSQPKLYDDQVTRNMVAGIQPSDVSLLRFSGLGMGMGGNEALEVADKQVIAGFLLALRHAQAPGGHIVLNRGYTLEIVFHAGKHSREPIDLPFALGYPKYEFGYEFDRMLHKLGRYEAATARQRISEVEEHVIGIVIGFLPLKTVSDPTEIEPILQELKQANDHWFAYTDVSVLFRVRLLLRNGDTKEFRFLIGPYSKNGHGSWHLPVLPPHVRAWCIKQLNMGRFMGAAPLSPLRLRRTERG